MSHRTLIVASAFVLATCKRDPAPPTDSFDRGAMLTSIADEVIVPAIRGAATEAVAFDAAAEAYAADASAAKQAAAQTAWRKLMTAWQAVEMVQVGPAALASQSTGGQGIRETIYVWPVTDESGVDMRVADGSYTDLGAAPIAVSDLGAAEYLLFGAVEPARAAYAAAIADRVRVQTQALVDAWDGGYRDRFVAMGQDGVNEVFQAMFYLALVVKDRKVARPAALSLSRSKPACPELAESRHSLNTRANLKANLDTFERVFTGGSGVGFDDFLSARGADALSADMAAKIDAAQAALAALPGGENAPLTEDVAAAQAFHGALKAIEDELKTQLVTVLNLRVPREGAGDND